VGMAMMSGKEAGEMAPRSLEIRRSFRAVGGHGLESVGRRHARGAPTAR